MTNKSILLPRGEGWRGAWGCDVITQYPSPMMNREFFSVPPLSIIKRAHLVFSVTQDQYKKQHMHFAINLLSLKSQCHMRSLDFISALAS